MASANSMLDLAFAMDCTGSMGSYIESAKNNIRTIIDEISTKESLNIHLALIEYRDHPPQDTTFVTRTHGFTSNVSEMKGWLDQSSAHGGGDGPEAVADALNDALNLSWRSNSTKISILISDAPPHGLNRAGDSFPDGCPAGFDPMTIARKMTEKNITLYVVGVEPPIVPYREFFMALAHITGGQYVPITDAARLTQMIIAGVREEVSLNRVMNNSRREIIGVMRQATKDRADDLETATRLQRRLDEKNVRVNRMNNTAGNPSRDAEECYSKCVDMADMQRQYRMTPSTSSTTKPVQQDYRLEEETNISLEQSKRIVQKAKSWNYPPDEPTHSTRSTRCKYGENCNDLSAQHRAKYEHPDSISRSTQRNHFNQHSTRSTLASCKYGENCHDSSAQHRAKYEHPSNQPPSSQRNHFNKFSTRSTQTPCKYGSDCNDHSQNHQEKYSHPATTTSGRTQTTCRYGENCHDDSDDHREKYSHPSNSTTNTRRSACRYGDDCRDTGRAHRSKYSHPDD